MHGHMHRSIISISTLALLLTRKKISLQSWRRCRSRAEVAGRATATREGRPGLAVLVVVAGGKVARAAREGPAMTTDLVRFSPEYTADPRISHNVWVWEHEPQTCPSCPSPQLHLYVREIQQAVGRCTYYSSETCTIAWSLFEVNTN